MQQVPVSGVFLHDLGPRPTAVSMFDGGHDDAATGQFSHILRVLGPGTGHAVRKDHDGESIVVAFQERIGGGGRLQHHRDRGVEGHVDVGRDLGASDQRPQSQGQDGVGDKVADAGELGVSGADETQGRRDPQMMGFGRDDILRRRVVEGEEDGFQLLGRMRTESPRCWWSNSPQRRHVRHPSAWHRGPTSARPELPRRSSLPSVVPCRPGDWRTREATTQRGEHRSGMWRRPHPKHISMSIAGGEQMEGGTGSGARVSTPWLCWLLTRMMTEFQGNEVEGNDKAWMRCGVSIQKGLNSGHRDAADKAPPIDSLGADIIYIEPMSTRW